MVLAYYSIGSIVLPSADFSIIPHLQELYTHCKETEDPDMNMADFITEHLMNLEGHESEEEEGERPHEPFDHKVNSSFSFFVYHPVTEISQVTASNSIRIVTPGKIYSFDFVGNIFRPPIC